MGCYAELLEGEGPYFTQMPSRGSILCCGGIHSECKCGSRAGVSKIRFQPAMGFNQACRLNLDVKMHKKTWIGFLKMHFKDYPLGVHCLVRGEDTPRH